MLIWQLILMLMAFVMFTVAAWLAPEPKPFTRFACVGLACWVLAQVIVSAWK